MVRKGYDFASPVRRILIGLTGLLLLALFLFWRISRLVRRIARHHKKEN